MNYFVKRPAPPTGNDPQAVWMRSLLAFLDTLTLRGIIGGRKINHPEGGFSLVIDPATIGAGGGLSTYRVKSRTGEYLVCRTWDGTTEGSTDVKVAKSFSCRRPTTETLGGVAITYAYTNGSDSLNDSRTATGTGVSETQMVVPYWTVDGVIAVATIAYSGVTADGADLKLIEVSARCWAQV